MQKRRGVVHRARFSGGVKKQSSGLVQPARAKQAKDEFFVKRFQIANLHLVQEIFSNATFVQCPQRPFSSSTVAQ
jgi:hypothetical protein